MTDLEKLREEVRLLRQGYHVLLFLFVILLGAVLVGTALAIMRWDPPQ